MENLNILNPKTIHGGQYQEVRLFAEVTVDGHLGADTLDVYDHAIFNGNVKAKKLKVNGHATFNGLVMAQEIVINGTVDFNQDVKTNKLTVKNQVNASDVKIESYETLIEGMGHFKELDAYNLIVHGMIQCSELLRCNNIEFSKTSRGSLKEVMGAIVSITPERFANDLSHKVLIDDLIAYDVTLKNTKINHIKARIIKQDEHTQIEHLEYIQN